MTPYILCRVFDPPQNSSPYIYFILFHVYVSNDVTHRQNQSGPFLFVSHLSWLLYVYRAYHRMSCFMNMLVFRHSPKKRRKEFANHFVLLLQFHESRNAAERNKEGDRLERRGSGNMGRDRERGGGLWEALVGPRGTVTYSTSTLLDGIKYRH